MALLNWTTAVSVSPTANPVTLDEAKTQLNIAVSVTDHDAHILDLIERATDMVENDADRALVTQTLVQKMDCWPDSDYLEIKRGPLATVTAIQYFDTAGSSQIFSSASYSVDTSRYPGLIYLNDGESWPGITTIKNAISVTYTAGVALASVPKMAKHAILLQVSSMFEEREPTPVMMSTYEDLIGRLKGGRYP